MNDRLATSAADDEVRVIAFYLPQFHQIPENDRWWGEGFTEWTNVRKAVPNFPGHYQPHVPGELGYYDLSDPEVRERQADLARAHGINGFCYYYYWFNGKRLLERPIDEVLASGKPDFPFCVCWPNENWTRRWDGLDQELLIAQDYSPEDSRAFIRSLIPLFRDPRYIRVNGRPLLLVYRTALIPDLARTVVAWREECAAAGVAEPYLVSALTDKRTSAESGGFDAAVEFPPHGHMAEKVNERLGLFNPNYGGMAYSLRDYVAQLLAVPRSEFRLFRTVMPSWDNTARRQDNGWMFVASSPELFNYWLEQALTQTRLRHQGDERLLFINAWNEWAEGCHLEPDQRYGRAWLEAVRSAVAYRAPPLPTRPQWKEVVASCAGARERGDLSIVKSRSADGPAQVPTVSVVINARNCQRHIASALDSAMNQTWRDLEIIVVDDGSTDDTDALLDARVNASSPCAITVAHQLAAGRYAAVNTGLTLARGEYVAILDGDDEFVSTRLQSLIEAMRLQDAGLAFSGTSFIDDDGTEFSEQTDEVESLQRGVSDCAAGEDPLHALLRNNVAVSPCNLVFRRDLLEHVGGFSALTVYSAWDFMLAASYWTRLAFVPDALYRYRLHGPATIPARQLGGLMEADAVLARFAVGIEQHRAYRDRRLRGRFVDDLRRAGLRGTLAAQSDGVDASK